MVRPVCTSYTRKLCESIFIVFLGCGLVQTHRFVVACSLSGSWQALFFCWPTTFKRFNSLTVHVILNCRAVLLFIALTLLILTTIHASVILQTARTKPVVMHPTQDDQRTYSHEELQHIVVRSLADVRATKHAAEETTKVSAKTELASTTRSVI